jgi:hypothetical protein
MKFWKLTPRHDTLWWCVEGKDPWSPHRERAFGFVVRAPDAEQARWLAHEAGGKENETIDGVAPWLDANYSTCDELRTDGGAEVLLVNFRY